MKLFCCQGFDRPSSAAPACTEQSLPGKTQIRHKSISLGLSPTGWVEIQTVKSKISRFIYGCFFDINNNHRF
jgi:hypothetical protein